MLNVKSVRCQSCGQGWQIAQTDVFNTMPARFCPICGTPTLQRDPTVLGIAAQCFTFAVPILVQMLYEQWRWDKNGEMAQFPRFLDYLNDQLTPKHDQEDE